MPLRGVLDYASCNVGQNTLSQLGRHFLHYTRQGYFQWTRDGAALRRTHHVQTAVANQMKSQCPQGGSIIGLSSISALVGGELQWSVITGTDMSDFQLTTKRLAITPPQRPASYP